MIERAKKIIVFIIIISFSSNNLAYAERLNVYFDLNKNNCSQKLDFDLFVQCLEKELTKQTKYKNSFEYRKNTISFLNIGFIYSDLASQKIINNKKAYELYDYLVTSDYSSELSESLENTILSSKCLDKNNFSIFINCLNDEFRSYSIYKKNSLENKFRFEEMMFNLLMNDKGSKVVFVDTNDNAIEFNKDKGFQYFEMMLDKISQDYFKNDSGIMLSGEEAIFLVDKSEQIRDALILIVAIIAISYVASKVVPKVIDKLTASSGSSGSSVSSSSTVSSAQSSTTYTYSNAGQFMPNLFRYAPQNSILRHAHFKRLLVSGRLGF